jgi:hypothetical protein
MDLMVGCYKYNYNIWNDSSENGEGKKKYRFGDKKKKKF